MKKNHKNISESTLKIKGDYRNAVELLRSRVALLVGTDKLLMTMYLDNGNSFRQMAKLLGVNEVTIARRIHKLTKRLIDSEYITCLRCRDKFTAAEMDIAKDYFLLGLSIKKIAAERSNSYYRVRETVRKVQNLVQVTNARK